MNNQKRGGTDFKTFMAAWAIDPYDGLRLRKIADAATIEAETYEVTDENGRDDDARKYTYKTLRDNLWPKA